MPAGIPHLLKGEHSLNVGRGVDSYSMMQPVGVCAGITPFNFPAMVPLWIVPGRHRLRQHLYPQTLREGASLSLRMAHLLKEAGLPDGVLNVVNGDKEVVDVLLTDPAGRCRVVCRLHPHRPVHLCHLPLPTARSAGAGRCQEPHGGGCQDADLDQAVSALMGAAYGAAGERCMAISVAVVVG